MPTISMFFGIIIRMYQESGERHHKAHIHALYAGREAVYAIDGELLEGGLPAKQNRYVRAWIDIHHEELAANWRLLQDNEKPFQIAPLR